MQRQFLRLGSYKMLVFPALQDVFLFLESLEDVSAYSHVALTLSSMYLYICLYFPPFSYFPIYIKKG